MAKEFPILDDPPEGKASRGGAHPVVVIVEDEPLLRAMSEALIEELGFETSAHETAERALDYIASDAGHVRAVFTDINVPGSIDGLALAKDVARRWPWIDVIVVTGGPSPEDGAIPAGAKFMLKPWRALDVIAALTP
jgi:DNA-binding NtrC family response regulator